MSVAPVPYTSKPATLGFFQAHFAIIHRTVRCTSGATATSRNSRLKRGSQMNTAAAESERRVRGAPDSEHDLYDVAPDCPVPQGENASNGQLLQNPNGGVTWRRTGLSGAPIDNSHPNGYVVVEGYKYPQPPQLQVSKSSEVFIQYKS
jgi:hypothetical protein